MLEQNNLLMAYALLRDAELFVVNHWKDYDNALDNFRVMQDLLGAVSTSLQSAIGLTNEVLVEALKDIGVTCD